MNANPTDAWAGAGTPTREERESVGFPDGLVGGAAAGAEGAGGEDGQARAVGDGDASTGRSGSRSQRGRDARARGGSSIRRRLSGLVVIPLLTVVGLDAFVLVTTVEQALNLGRAPSLINVTSVPTARFVDTYLAAERRAALVYLAVPTAANRARLAATQAATQQATPALRAELTSPASRSAATPSELTVIDQLLTDLGNLASVRAAVDSRAITPAQAFAAYNTLVTDEFHLFMQEVQSLTDATAATQALAIVETTESHQFLLEEDALISAALAAHHVTAAVRAQVAELAGARRAAYAEGIAGLDRADLAAFTGPFDRYASGATMSTLTSLEDAFTADPSTRPPFSASRWDPVATAVSNAYFYGGVNSIEAQGRRDHRLTVAAWLRVAVAGGLGLLGLVASIVVSSLVGRGIIRRLARLRDFALHLADEQLPDVVGRLRRGEDVPATAVPPDTPDGNDEIAQVGRAFDAARRTAIQSAVDEARLRRGISEVFRNIARRSQSLLHRQLTVLDGMERRTTDPALLDDLFRIDHLATRMRRHAEGLIVLSGGSPARGWVRPVRMVDVLRAAAAEVEDYARVAVVCPGTAALAGPAVGDVIHLLAELIENAATMSPPYTPVRVLGDVVGKGFAVEIEDRGLGMSDKRLAEVNARLAQPPEFDLTDSERLGLFVVGRLAQRHGIRVTLRPSPFGGTTAIVLIPQDLVVLDEQDVAGLPVGVAAVPAAQQAVPAAPPAVSGATPAPPPAPVPAVAAGPAPKPGSTGDVTPVAGQPAVAGQAGPDTAAGQREPADPAGAAEEPDVFSTAAPAPAGTAFYKGLPRRVRQAHLAPQLRDAPSTAAASTDTVLPAPVATPPPGGDAATHRIPRPVGERSPEEVRAMMSAMQRGWERGRQTVDRSEENR